MGRTLAVLVTAGVLASIAVLGVRIYRDVAERQALSDRIERLGAVELRTLAGEPRRLDARSSGRPVVLVFFRTTCPYCRAEIRSIRAHEALTQAADVILLSAETGPELDLFAEAEGLLGGTSPRVLRDESGAVHARYDVKMVPRTYVYRRDGRLRAEFKGEASADALFDALEADRDLAARVRRTEAAPRTAPAPREDREDREER